MTRTAANKSRLYFAILVLGGFTADAAEISLKSEYECHETTVTLGQVATISGAVEDVSRLSEIFLFPAPRKGRERSLRVSEVHELLRLHGFDPLSHKISGAAVSRLRGTTTTEKVKPMPVQIGTAKNVAAKSPTKVLVAARDLPRNQTIRESDLKLTDFTGVLRASKPTDQPSDVLGRETTRPIPAGQVIDVSQLQRPVLIRRNDTVTVLSRSAGVEVRTQAKATEDGALGDLIVLESPGNKQKYSARVAAVQLAEVYASGATVARVATYTRVAKSPENQTGIRTSRDASSNVSTTR